ncbi:MAG TPA: cation diffusion facilitator family transporter [Candidatus Kapabacteria bacterium]|nr:cation diffusion facilitator family transporter [Candidatus Kapabacteria bacterium]
MGGFFTFAVNNRFHNHSLSYLTQRMLFPRLQYFFQTWRRRLRRSSPMFMPTIALIACTVLAVLGIIIGASADSLIVETNGWISAVEIINAALFIMAVERSTKSADFQFNYGYGKYESLAILSSSVLLTVIGIYVTIEAVNTFGNPTETNNFWFLAVYSFLCFILIRTITLHMKKAAANHQIPVLYFDADLWEADSWMELAVSVNLIIGGILHAYGYDAIARYLDSGSAIALLAYTVSIPLRHGKNALDQILDKTLPENVQMDILSSIIARFDSFCEFKAVHTRQSGRDIFIEIDLILPFDWTLEQSRELEKNIAHDLKEKYPTSIMRLYAQPCPRDCFRNGECFCPLKQ